MMRCHSATADARYVAVGACAVDRNVAYTICGCQTVNAVYPNHLLEQTARFTLYQCAMLGVRMMQMFWIIVQFHDIAQ